VLVVFEGIDGSGKTTVSNRVARELAELGLRVRHVREGGRLASATAESIRQLARDQRHAALSPTAEMLLYAARDAQQLDECIRPALGEADVIIADRFLYTAWVMAVTGRGLPEADAAAVVRAAGRGLEADLHVLIDVDPSVARARRRVHRLLEPDARPPGRKGLSGEGLMHRLREGYRRLAAADTARWVVVDNTDAVLDAVVEDLCQAILAARAAAPGQRADAARTVMRARARGRGMGTGQFTAHPSPADAGEARTSFLVWIDRRRAHEPALAAWLLGGMAGPGVDERRRALAPLVPRVVARGLTGLVDEESWLLREGLAAAAPGEVAASLKWAAADGARAWALREQLAAVAPIEVAASLVRLDGARAWAMRRVLWAAAPAAVVASLAGNGSDESWAWREQFMVDQGDAAWSDPETARALVSSVTGLDDERAWEVRRRAKHAALAATLTSLAGVVSDRAYRWREKWLERAPRPVLRSLAGLEDDHAWALRERGLSLSGKDALASVWGLASEPAWALREHAAATWPASVVAGLGPTAQEERGRALVARLLREHPRHLMLWKHAGATVTGAGAPVLVVSR
jgi:dTMP kinase